MELREARARVGTRACGDFLLIARHSLAVAIAMVCSGLVGPARANLASDQATGGGGAPSSGGGGAKAISQPNWMIGPAEAAPPCVPTEEEIEVCGRKETIFHQCGFPVITPEMEAEAAGHPVLTDQHERVNTCVSESKDCKAHDPRQGGSELVEELERIKSTLHEMPTKIKFHFSVTATKLEKVRDDMAIVSKKGFVRDIVAQVMLYRLEDHQKFHHNAEGVDLVAMKAAEKERAELRKMEDALKEMQSKFDARNDIPSAVNSSGFALIARQRAFEMEAVACELKRMAGINHEREEKMKSLGMEIVGGVGQGAGVAQAPMAPSDISGLGNEKKLPDPEKTEQISRPGREEKEPKAIAEANLLAEAKAGRAPASAAQVSSTGASRMPGFFTQQEFDDSLSPFGENPDEIARRNQALKGPAAASEDDESLFDRLHRQYRARERAGDFYRTVAD